MSTDNNPLHGVKIFNHVGEEKSLNEIMNGKELLAVYFGAHWVPPCRIFKDDMAKFCQSATAVGKLATIFVSYDGKKEAFDAHREKLPNDWYHIKLEDESSIASVSSALEADDLPHVAILRPNMSVVGNDGGGPRLDARATIAEDPAAAFEQFQKRAAE